MPLIAISFHMHVPVYRDLGSCEVVYTDTLHITLTLLCLGYDLY